MSVPITVSPPYDYRVTTYFHVSSSRNRDSIERHGLDPARMGEARGVAGSVQPEVDGVFLCRDEGEVSFFCTMNANDGPVDVWAVAGVREANLIESPEGFAYVEGVIPPQALTLAQAGRVPLPFPESEGSIAYRSALTITFDDGRVVRGPEAHDLLRREALPGDQSP
jgi:hypothetical protein